MLFRKAVEKQIQLVSSNAILTEFIAVSDDPRIRKYAGQEDIIPFLRVIGKIAEIAKVKSRFKAVVQDPNDDIILRTAVDGKADIIVSGDKHLLSLGTFRGIKIMNSDQLLTLVSKEQMQK
jgi:putative PIN family toxin of toxin-antitoxin system